MKKAKIDRYRLRWSETRKTGKCWVPSAWSTNSIKVAQQHCNEIVDHTERQIWDYEDKKALTPDCISN